MRSRDLRRPMTVDDVEQARFGTARWGEGYDMRQVDEELDRLARTLSRPTGSEPDRLSLRRTWLQEGYRAREVERFWAWARATCRATPTDGYAPPPRRLTFSVVRAVLGLVWFAVVLGALARLASH